MVIKLKTVNDILGKGWVFIDKIERASAYITNNESQKGTLATMIFIKNTPNAQANPKEDIALDCMYIDCLRNGEDYGIYTELPAYLLNDKGETIERLN